MKELSNIKKISLSLCGIGLLFVGFIMSDAISKLSELDEEARTISTESSCSTSTLYMSENGNKVYTYCLDSIKVNVEGKFMELSEYYKENKLILDKITRKMEEKTTYDDGGTKLYISDINDLAILRCKTKDGNNDTYIGHKDMGYEIGFCEDRIPPIEAQEFEKVYHVYNVISAGNDEIKYVTLYEPEGTDVETVKVKASLASKLKRDKKYTFKFYSESIPFESDIKTVFNNSEVVEIVEYKG